MARSEPASMLRYMKISYLVYLHINNLTLYVHCNLLEIRNKRSIVSFSSKNLSLLERMNFLRL